MLLAACGTAANNATSQTKGSAPTIDQGVKSAIENQLGTSPANASATTFVAATQKSAESADRSVAGAVPSPPGPGAPAAAGPVVPPALQPTDIGRSIIFSAAIAVQADDITLASNEAMRAIAGFGGFLFGQQGVSEPTPRQVLTFKVFPKDFQPALAKLGGLGKLIDQKVSADDVTERVVDLESRVRTSEVSVARLREFLQGATNLDVVARLENELLQRETQLEQLKGQLRTVQAQVELATIQLTLTQAAPPGPGVKVSVTAYRGSDAEAVCPGDDRVEATEGERWTFCYDIENVGSNVLSAVKLDDGGLRLDPQDLKVLSGNAASLKPGESLVLAGVKELELGQVPRPRVRAVPLDSAGDVVRGEVRVEYEEFKFTLAADDSLPGFVDALKGGWNALLRIGSVVLLLVGALLPFAWLPVVLWLGWRWWRRRRPRKARQAPKQWQPLGAPRVGPVDPREANPPSAAAVAAGVTTGPVPGPTGSGESGTQV